VAGMDDVGPVDEAERLAHGVVGDQNADAAVAQVTHEILDVAGGDRCPYRKFHPLGVKL
jgi:hypothetical protein